MFDNIVERLYLYNNIRISNNEAKIKLVKDHNIIIFNNENERIGFLNFGDYICCGGQGISFIYSTENTNVSGNNHDFNYKLKLNKGWNIIYNFRRSSIQGRSLSTTNGKSFPDDLVWQLILYE